MKIKSIIVWILLFIWISFSIVYSFYIIIQDDNIRNEIIDEVTVDISEEIDNENNIVSNNTWSSNWWSIINGGLNSSLINIRKEEEKTVLTEIIDSENKQNTKTINKLKNIIILNNWISWNNKIIPLINNYIENINENNIKDIQFLTINNTSSNNCKDTFSIKKVSKYSPFDRLSNDLKILNLLEYIKEIDKTNDTFYIINWNNLNYNCNNIEEIKLFLSKNKDINFKNVIILKNKNSAEINDNFFENLTLYSGIKYKEISDLYEYENILNKNIYSFNNSWSWILSNKKINTQIYFYDQNEDLYAWELRIYKKEWNNFNIIQKLNVSEKYYWDLNPWIYYFVAYDPISKIKYTTDPVTININNPFEYNFIFRETKLEIKIIDEDNKPLLWNINIKYEWTLEKYDQNYNNKSNLILYWKPWDYEIKVLIPWTNDNFIEKFSLKWEKFITKSYKTTKNPLTITVYENWRNLKENVIISIIKNNETIKQKSGSTFETELSTWTYMVNVKDITSWIILSKEINIKEQFNWEDISFLFETQQVNFDIWRDPKIIKLYTKNFYPNKVLSSFSGTGIKNIKLIPWEYIIEVYDINKELIKKENITVDTFFENYFEI